MRQIRDSQGFTLIELMIVVVIIGILAAIAIPRFTAVSDQAKQAEAEPILKQICSLATAERMRSATNAWPADLASISGWTDPSPKHFSAFGFTQASGTATATTTNPSLRNVSMTCADNTITLGANGA